MAKFSVDIDPEFVRMIERMSNVDEIAPKMLEVGAEVIERNVKNKLRAHMQSGDLLRSIRIAKAKKNKYGWYINVRPTGKDKKGVRNIEKLVYLEHGTKNQPPRPVLTSAVNESRAEVADKMRDIFEREVLNGR